MEEEKKINVSEESYKVFELAFDILGVGYLDLKHLIYYNEAIKKFDKDFDYKEELNNIGNDDKVTDANNLYYVVIDRLFYSIIGELENLKLTKKQKNKINVLKDNFSPFINCLDSWFNNIFDELDLSKEKDDIIQDAIKLLSKD
jgi:hypothetical protein